MSLLTYHGYMEILSTKFLGAFHLESLEEHCFRRCWMCSQGDLSCSEFSLFIYKMTGAITQRLLSPAGLLTSPYPWAPRLQKLHFAMAIPSLLFTCDLSPAPPSNDLSASHWFFFAGDALFPVTAETINKMGGRGRGGEGSETQRE